MFIQWNSGNRRVRLYPCITLDIITHASYDRYVNPMTLSTMCGLQTASVLCSTHFYRISYHYPIVLQDDKAPVHKVSSIFMVFLCWSGRALTWTTLKTLEINWIDGCAPLPDLTDALLPERSHIPTETLQNPVKSLPRRVEAAIGCIGKGIFSINAHGFGTRCSARLGPIVYMLYECLFIRSSVTS